MRVRRRSLLGLVLVGAAGVAYYVWRARKGGKSLREALQTLVPDRVKELVRKALRPNQAAASDGKANIVVTGLEAPEARPLDSVDALLAWRPPPPDPACPAPSPDADPDAPFCRTYNTPLMRPASDSTSTHASSSTSTPAHPAPAAASAASAGTGPAGPGGAQAGPLPRLLVCHDMMGGYLADRFVQGAPEPGAYRLWQWPQIDVFIYFSHRMVTLPPPGWVAAAHRNGVRVLGTFITEWEEGRSRCERLFASPAAARTAADQLAALAAHGGFEGWLVNIENGLDPALVPNVTHFVAHLRARMAAAVGPQALVIWYDAMTTEGRLAWQDGLTRLNAPFFDAADALFVNYKWTESAPAAVAAAAGSRATEVYMGVDVFGRGSYGGGKDNCPVALAAARASGLSAALFAPGWVYEEFDRATFEPRQEAFWAAIGAAWPARPGFLRRLPLASCFNGGAGRGVWLEGALVSRCAWHNLAAQDAVAQTTPLAAAGDKGLVVRPTQRLAFTGGSCLAFTGPGTAPSAATSAGALPYMLHTLYTADLPVPPAGLDLSFTHAFGDGCRLAIVLLTAPPAAAAVAAGAATVGVAVGAWGPDDGTVVDALKRAGIVAVSCPAFYAGATTTPLPDVPSSAAASIPSGQMWFTCAGHLPLVLLSPAAASGASSAAAAATAAAVVTAVGVVAYRSGGGGGGGGSGGSGPAAPAGPFCAFLGRLVIKEHRPTGPAGKGAAAADASPSLDALYVPGPLPIAHVDAPPPPASPPPPLTAACCARVHWSRPGVAAVASAAAAAATDGAASSEPGRDAGPPSAELVEGRSVESDDGWDRTTAGPTAGPTAAGSGSGGGAVGGSPVRLRKPRASDDDALGAEEEDVEGSSEGGGAGAGERLLTCELAWKPQFDEWGSPRHRCYQVWAHFNVDPAPSGGGRTPLPGVVLAPAPSPTGVKEGRKAKAGKKGNKEAESAWELLHPDWSGAVWAGEAFVARYRLVQLEVPSWARSVTLLVQPVSWEGAELGSMQPLACVGVPPT
ncbi:hypothetical protein HYH03_004736 [Edaphochlamys debaryana]|uniref:Cytosolic endo-beta-N-acetylglucosaminidase TIM barrel domain-containing protein n=1 Tax=Edaphochlamys debaryana TaxID=47281 RepID=A0A835Y6J9_9CHLO|nr:hypothetical protein HYH03_004736 [Edaphochlamys debaryana]|eukprot:KAG2497145.1 hypothetical protein HYH03_004736 [Edaphochlamys debaryana]